jgi:hypothetical protein
MFIVKFYVKMSKHVVYDYNNIRLYELTFVNGYVNGIDIFR